MRWPKGNHIGKHLDFPAHVRGISQQFFFLFLFYFGYSSFWSRSIICVFSLHLAYLKCSYTWPLEFQCYFPPSMSSVLSLSQVLTNLVTCLVLTSKPSCLKFTALLNLEHWFTLLIPLNISDIHWNPSCPAVLCTFDPSPTHASPGLSLPLMWMQTQCK